MILITGWEIREGSFFTYNNSTLSQLSNVEGLGKFPKNIKESIIELYLNNHKITDISCLAEFTGLKNVIMPSNPELHSLAGLENKKDLLYIAAQQPNLKDETGKTRSDMGYEDLDGLRGCSGLLYLVLFNNTNLQDISGIKDASNLERLYANNCNINSTDGLQGKDGNGLDNLSYLNLENNVNLESVSQISLCDEITELYLAGNIKMIEAEAMALEDIITRCGDKHSIPPKYSLGFSSVTSLDFSNKDLTDSNLDDLKCKTNIRRLNLKGCKSLTDGKINYILSTMTNLEYLVLNGVTHLTSINFANNLKLVELDIRNTNVTDLSPLNDESSENLSALLLKNDAINDYPVLIENVCNNAGKILTLNKLDDNFSTSQKTMSWWNSSSNWNYCGLVDDSVNITIEVPGDVDGFSCCSYGNGKTIFDLSNCTKLKYIYVGSCDGKIIFPSSLEGLAVEGGDTGDFDFSLCSGLSYFETKATWDKDLAMKSFSSLPDDNVLSSLLIHRSGLPNLNFLGEFNCSNLRYLVFNGSFENTKLATSFTSLSGIENAQSLTGLTVSRTGLVDLTGLDHLTNLTSLNLTYNKLDNTSQVTFIEKCMELISLDISNNQVSTISFLSNLAKLKTANLSNNSFSQIPELSKLTVLNNLNISNCLSVTDLGALGTVIKADGTTNLRKLNLQGCAGIESTNTSNGFDNKALLDRLKTAGCDSITTTGTSL